MDRIINIFIGISALLFLCKFFFFGEEIVDGITTIIFLLILKLDK